MIEAIKQQFTEQQLRAFRRYVKVQHSGKYNMFDPRARALTGLDRNEYIFVMEHYDALAMAAEQEVLK